MPRVTRDSYIAFFIYYESAVSIQMLLNNRIVLTTWSEKKITVTVHLIQAYAVVPTQE